MSYQTVNESTNLTSEHDRSLETHHQGLLSRGFRGPHNSAKVMVASALIVCAAYVSSSAFLGSNILASPAGITHTQAFKMKRKDHNHKHCESADYAKFTAKTAYEISFAALFQDTKGESKFEASSIFKHTDGYYYAVCDNSWAISKFSYELAPFSQDNIMIGNPKREEEDSGYETIFANGDTFYAIRESVDFGDGEFHAIIEELSLGEDDYVVKAQCRTKFTFDGDSKGFEGGFGMPGPDGEFYIVGVCEGNHCSNDKELKGDAGNGMMVMMKKTVTDTECFWETVGDGIKIPDTADFVDYSDIAVTASGKVAITSQENSAVFIGQLQGIVNGIIDPDEVMFDENKMKVIEFPKSDVCLTEYCNIEGIEFINDNMLMAASDKMKAGKQPHYCLQKDQSVHAFVLP